MSTLVEDLRHALNIHSAENGSDTPDWILAEFLSEVLEAFNHAVRKRSAWYGHHDQPGRCQHRSSEPIVDPAAPKCACLGMCQNDPALCPAGHDGRTPAPRVETDWAD